MKATSGRLPIGAAWVYEPKWDGHRAVVRVRGGRVDAASSTGRNRTDSWTWLPDALGTMSGSDDCVLDGEVVAFGDDGVHSFQLVGDPSRDHAFVVFDLLRSGATDLFDLPWSERRERLVDLIDAGPSLIVTPVSSDGPLMFDVTAGQGLEGVVAKRTDSRYLPGRRTTSWVKVKHRRTQEFVVGGVLRGAGRRASTFGSLLLGAHDELGGPLRFVGAAGSGLTDSTLSELWARVPALTRDGCPFDPEPALPRGTATWLEPILVAQVEFAEWTAGGHLRHPVFRGLRDDVDPTAVTRSP